LTTKICENLLFFIFPSVYDSKFNLKFWSSQVSFSESKACTAYLAFMDATPLV